MPQITLNPPVPKKPNQIFAQLDVSSGGGVTRSGIVGSEKSLMSPEQKPRLQQLRNTQEKETEHNTSGLIGRGCWEIKEKPGLISEETSSVDTL